MTTALYRRYRPETFAEVVGQDHVTGPLRQALRSGQTNHAYLFSGPRGCGKTTSARILARCLNCAQGPTDTPCGECESCVELARGGPGSLDVVEIDAASHGGVDDARDLRERATFAPARDRYKVFILDEAHMVSPQGFNALLKIVEEPPPHIKFIFATTEPDKVIGTIRSRTHHYPFRLVPPEVLTEYLGQICTTEQVAVGSGVLPLVVRAGGGSVRDSLSVLDQLIAGSGTGGLVYEDAVALLGYTHAALLDDLVEAIAARDGASAFRVVERVIATGHEPRRFVEDLLERLRDLIVLQAAGDSAAAVLRDVPGDQLARMQAQAAHLGAAELSRSADLTNATLTEMTGATSPRLHLELLMARLMLPALDDSASGLGARVDRLEREGARGGGAAVPAGATWSAPAPAAPALADPAARPSGEPIGGTPVAAAAPSPVAPPADPVEAPVRPVRSASAPTAGDAEDGARPGSVSATGAVAGGPASSAGAPGPADGPGPRAAGPASSPAASDGPPAPAGRPTTGAAGRQGSDGAPDGASPGAAPVAAPGAGPGPAEVVTDDWGVPVHPVAAPSPSRASAGRTSGAPPASDGPRASAPAPAATQGAAAGQGGGPDTEVLRRRWPEVLDTLSRLKKATWVLISQNAQVMDLDATTLRLGFAAPGLAAAFRTGAHPDLVQQAVRETLGFDVRVEPVLAADAAPAPAARSAVPPARPADPGAGTEPPPDPWAQASPGPGAGGSAADQVPEAAAAAEADDPRAPAPAPGPVDGPAGAAVVAPADDTTPDPMTPSGAAPGTSGAAAEPVSVPPSVPAPGTRTSPPAAGPEQASAGPAAEAPAAPERDRVPDAPAPPPWDMDDPGPPEPPEDDWAPPAPPMPRDDASDQGARAPAAPAPSGAMRGADRVRAAARQAQVRTPAVAPTVSWAEDEPSMDDPDIGSGALSGVALVAQVLGGVVIEEQMDEPI